MFNFKRYLLVLAFTLLLPVTARLAPGSDPQEGWQVYTDANWVKDLALQGGGALGGGYTWVATSGGVVCYSASEQIKFTTLDGLTDNNVYAITEDGEGRWWFSTWGGGVSVLDDGGTPLDKGDDTWIAFTTADGLVQDWVEAITKDSEGRLWFGTLSGGVSVLDYGGTLFDKRDDIWTTFSTADGLAHDRVQAIVEDVGGRLWLGTQSGGVSVLDDNGTPFDKSDDAWTTFSTLDGLTNDNVQAIVEDSGGRLWFGTNNGGVSVLDNGGTPFDKGDDAWIAFTTADGLAGVDYVRAIVEDGEGRLWFGGWGASVLDYGGTLFDKADDAWTTFTYVDGLAVGYALAVATDGGE